MSGSARLRLALVGALALAGAAFAAHPPVSAAPAVITVPDCGDGFTMDVRPRRNPEALGTVTRDGYPVLLDREGENRYVMPRGMVIHTPVILRGHPLPDHVPAQGR